MVTDLSYLNPYRLGNGLLAYPILSYGCDGEATALQSPPGLVRWFAGLAHWQAIDQKGDLCRRINAVPCGGQPNLLELGWQGVR